MFIADTKLFIDGFADYIKTGVLQKNFENVLARNQFPGLFREENTTRTDPTLCYLCNSVVDLVLLERKIGLSRETFVDEVIVICTHLGIENERVCKGVSELNVVRLNHLTLFRLFFILAKYFLGCVLIYY